VRTTPVDARTAGLLDNPVKPYAWGSATELPRLLGVPPTGRPQAELWMGAHPAAPSRLRAGPSLPALIEADPAGQLSAPVVRRFGARLPFLMKVIAAERNLSLQTHPNLEQAKAGYADEEQRRVPLDSPERSYVDPNHKPELVCALTPFEALCGFRSIPVTVALLSELAVTAPGLGKYVDALRARPDSDGLREVVTGLLTVPADRRKRLVDSVVAACSAGSGEFATEFATAVELGRAYPGDPGVVIALLLNRLRLEPGQALFLYAGNMHCYLRGTAVEVLASSDNVLRGGLTAKHVDVPELLRVVDVSAGPPPLMTPEQTGPGHVAYRPPVPDFRLDTFELTAEPVEIGVTGPRIMLTVEGTASLRTDGRVLSLPQGASAWVPAGVPATVAGSGRLLAATTNL
jgi:mannose-6-phosphate isomerase